MISSDIIYIILSNEAPTHLTNSALSVFPFSGNPHTKSIYIYATPAPLPLKKI